MPKHDPVPRRSRLSDPEYAAFAWARYRRIMLWVLGVSVLCVGASVAWLMSDGSVMSVHVLIATIAAVGLSVLLAGALMGLIFLSSGTGHDEDIAAFDPDKE
jgi:hypothetical protein